MMRAELSQVRTAIDFSASDFIDLSATPWRRITLSARDNIWCLVDAEDFEWLSRHKWNVSYGTSCKWKLYAKRNVGPARDTLRMHREILIKADPQPDAFLAKHFGDHFNGHGLDNRRANLSWATPLENRGNTRQRGSVPSLEAIVLQLMAERGYAQPQEVPF